MKYIRTKDGRIFEKNDNLQIIDNTICNMQNGKVWLMLGEILKQADTIEELCDGYIVESKNNPAIWFEMTCEEYSRGKPNFNNWIIYAYIKTDKGLIYKTRMKGILPNGEIDWELL